MRKLIFSILLALAGDAFADSAYREPDLDAPLFNTAEVALAPEDRSRLATNIAAYIQRIGESAPRAQLDFAAQALGIALRLDPENRLAALVNSRLRRGLPAPADDVAADPKMVATDLHLHARAAKRAGGEDNGKVAGYLLELAAAIDPNSEAIARDLAFYRKAGHAADWSFVPADP